MMPPQHIRSLSLLVSLAPFLRGYVEHVVAADKRVAILVLQLAVHILLHTVMCYLSIHEFSATTEPPESLQIGQLLNLNQPFY